ncbi:MAG: NADH-quinone oxidoreductase subunit N [bacterium]|nr:NADH-quinone oxidoreductase subunit N [bacterium]
MNWAFIDWTLLAPEIIVLITALLIFGLDLIWGDESERETLGWLGILGLIFAFYATLALGQGGELFNHIYVVDSLSIFSKQILLGIGVLIILASLDYIKGATKYEGEYYGLLLLAILAMMLISSAAELITIFICLEFATLTCIILSAYFKHEPKSTEAGLKYLLVGLLSAVVLLYGISLVYGLTGTTTLYQIGGSIRKYAFQPVLFISCIFLAAGFGFKIAAVPFHTWAPDTYEGAPTPITAFLATASKVAGFVILLRFFVGGLGDIEGHWIGIMVTLAVLSMSIGNLSAIPQTDIKRMLAYSSIAHAGYILIGLAVLSRESLTAVLFYLLAYAAANLGAFLVIIAFSKWTDLHNISDYAGLSKRSPLLALSMLLALMSMAGIPPLGGFIGKFYIFAGAVSEAVSDPERLWLIGLPVWGVIFSIVSVYYYFGVIKAMYLVEPVDTQPIPIPVPLGLALLIAILLTLLIGIYPGPFLALSESAIQSIF